jgi:FKBP-type peptidyl-prolyl cis-trans isomerase FklB
MKAVPVVLVAFALVVCAALSRAAVEPAAPEAAAAKPPEPKLETLKDKISYSLGVTVARSLKREGFDLTPSAFLRGVSDGLTNTQPVLTEEEMGQAMGHARQLMAARVQELRKGAPEALKRGQAFLAENAKKQGVVTLPDGLQYRVITPGDGPSPGPADTVTVNYRGTLIDGTEFDSSYGRGEPAHFAVGRVIRGWQEALQKMKKGAKWEIFIPSDLAYGADGMPPAIGPNEVLIFTVELLDIQKQ